MVKKALFFILVLLVAVSCRIEWEDHDGHRQVFERGRIGNIEYVIHREDGLVIRCIAENISPGESSPISNEISEFLLKRQNLWGVHDGFSYVSKAENEGLLFCKNHDADEIRQYIKYAITRPELYGLWDEFLELKRKDVPENFSAFLNEIKMCDWGSEEAKKRTYEILERRLAYM